MSATLAMKMALSWRKLRSNRPHLGAINRYEEVRSSEVEETKFTLVGWERVGGLVC